MAGASNRGIDATLLAAGRWGPCQLWSESFEQTYDSYRWSLCENSRFDGLTENLGVQKPFPR
jgi:hypothetical protein